MGFYMETKQKLRKLKHTLYNDGLGVIMLGGWSVLKLVMSVIGGGNIFDYVNAEIDEDNLMLVKIFTYIFLVLVIIIIFFVHYYIGSRAMRVGKKDSKKRFFLIPTGFICIITLLSSMLSIAALKDNIDDLDTLSISLILDIMLSFLLLDIIVSTIRVGRLQKQIIAKEGE